MAFLTGKQTKIYLLAVGGLSIIALLATVVIMLLSGGDSNAGGGDKAYEAETALEAESFSQAAGTVVQELQVPRDFSRLYQKDWKAFRRQLERWRWEQISPYWIDPEVLVREELEKRTDRQIDSFFEELP